WHECRPPRDSVRCYRGSMSSCLAPLRFGCTGTARLGGDGSQERILRERLVSVTYQRDQPDVKYATRRHSTTREGRRTCARRPSLFGCCRLEEAVLLEPVRRHFVDAFLVDLNLLVQVDHDVRR